MENTRNKRFNYISLILLFLLGLTMGGSAELKAGDNNRYEVTEIYLSDLEWTSSTSGWDGYPPRLDESVERNPLTLNGVTYEKGIGTHANGETVYHLKGDYDSFKSDIGVDDEMDKTGSVVFQVYLDGVEAYDSDLMTGESDTLSVNLDIRGTNELKLVVTNGGNGNGADHGDWAGARVLSYNKTDSGEQDEDDGSVPDDLFDNDNDGITNSDEKNIYGTDPNKADTDGDGVNDGDEIAEGRDPLRDLSEISFIEHRTFTVTSTEWRKLNYIGDFSDPVVLATPVYSSENTLPGVVRVRNISNNSCEIRIAVLNDSTDTDVTREVNMMIIEKGVYTFDEHGIKMEVIAVDIFDTDYQDNYNGHRFDYQQAYIDPVILGQVTTSNDNNWSTFWAKNITSDFAIIGKQVGEDVAQDRMTEQVAVVVIESGDYNLYYDEISAGITDEKIEGVENYNGSVVYGMPFADIIVLSLASMQDENGGFPILVDNSAPVDGRLVLAIDEDQFQDVERQHNTEKVSWMSIKQKPVAANSKTNGDGGEEEGSCFILTTF